jgi:hypothetical protein
MRLYHYGSARDGDALAARGHRIARRGERIALPPPAPEAVLAADAGAAP